MDNKVSLLQSQKEYTFIKYNDQLFYEQTACQCLFNGSMFRKCELQNSNFSNCDYEGTIFHDTNFQNVKLLSCDIKSSYYQNCNFYNCDFSLSAITDVEFLHCKFINCKFDDCLIKECSFNSCMLESGSYKMATFILSKFKNCNFDNLLLGNCSFYDHVMENCTFNNITINIDSIGRIYGLTPTCLENFKYIFLGNIYGYAPQEFFERIESIFEQKDWRFQKILYKFNMKKCSPYEYICNIFDTLIYFIDNNIIVKHDDLLFLSNIINHMKESNSLPLFALYQGIERLSDYIIILKEESYYNKEDIFREFFNKLFFVFNELLADFAEIFPEKIETGILSEQVLLKIHYDGKEEIDFSKYINRFLEISGYSKKYYCNLLQTKNGSLIEIIIGSIIAVYALQILLYGVNGVLIQLTDMVSKIGVLRNKNYQKNYLSNSVKGKQYQPELLGNTFDVLKNTEFKENVKTLASVLNTSKIIDVSTDLNSENSI